MHVLCLLSSRVRDDAVVERDGELTLRRNPLAKAARAFQHRTDDATERAFERILVLADAAHQNGVFARRLR